jgi:hypothetical protein
VYGLETRFELTEVGAAMQQLSETNKDLITKLNFSDPNYFLAW